MTGRSGRALVKRLVGSKGERLAARYLRRLGYTLIARNYSCPAGEIDIVARDGDTVVFVEVKTRSTAEHGDPEDQIGAEKMRRLTRSARYFVARHGVQHLPCRFDVLAVLLPSRGKSAIEHFPNAFGPNGN